MRKNDLPFHLYGKDYLEFIPHISGSLYYYIEWNIKILTSHDSALNEYKSKYESVINY